MSPLRSRRHPTLRSYSESGQRANSGDRRRELRFPGETGWLALRPRLLRGGFLGPPRSSVAPKPIRRGAAAPGRSCAPLSTSQAGYADSGPRIASDEAGERPIEHSAVRHSRALGCLERGSLNATRSAYGAASRRPLPCGTASSHGSSRPTTDGVADGGAAWQRRGRPSASRESRGDAIVVARCSRWRAGAS